jgi:hypothetical protein
MDNRQKNNRQLAKYNGQIYTPTYLDRNLFLGYCVPSLVIGNLSYCPLPIDCLLPIGEWYCENKKILLIYQAGKL